MSLFRATAVSAATLIAAAMATASAASPPISTRIVNDENAPVAIRWLHARQTSEGISVNGFVRRNQIRKGATPGYIELEIKLADQTIQRRCVIWQHIPRRGLQGASFAGFVMAPLAAPPEYVVGRYMADCASGDPS